MRAARGDGPLCVALDEPDRVSALALARAVAPYASVLKVGLTLYTSTGPPIVAEMSELRPVFLDLKLHDIPAQVGGAVRASVGIGASFVTVHASGGRDMIRAAVDAADGVVTILAVTVLTSLGEDDLVAIGYGRAQDAVLRLAELAVEANAPGLVCSPHEVDAIRSRFGAPEKGGPMLVVPGVRPQGSGVDDQARVATPREAVAAGADLIVVGRPITRAPDPAAAARSLLEEALS